MLIKKNKSTFLSSNLAGFGHTEGYLVLDQLKPGTRLIMLREDQNPHDHEAIALFYEPVGPLPEGTQLHAVSLPDMPDDCFAMLLHVGYVPSHVNSQLALMLDFGYADCFECVVESVDKEEHPNEQVHIRVNLLKKEA